MSSSTSKLHQPAAIHRLLLVVDDPNAADHGAGLAIGSPPKDIRVTANGMDRRWCPPSSLCLFRKETTVNTISISPINHGKCSYISPINHTVIVVIKKLNAILGARPCMIITMIAILDVNDNLCPFSKNVI